jgi:hypothetical protein
MRNESVTPISPDRPTQFAGGMAPQVIETALRLGIFDLLDRGALDADSAIEIVVMFYTAADEIAAMKGDLMWDREHDLPRTSLRCKGRPQPQTGIGSGAPPNRSSDQPLAEAIGQSSRVAQRKQG